MKKVLCLSCMAIALAGAAPAQASDSVAGSVASPFVASAAVSSAVAVSAYAGGEMVVESMRAVGNGIEVILKGAAHASRVVLTLTADVVKAASLGVGQSVKVVAEGSGHLLVASGKALCFVPGDEDLVLMHSAPSP